MSSHTRDDTSSGDARPKRIIYDIQSRALAAVADYFDERLRGTITEQTRRELATTALLYREALWKHRDEKALTTPWEERPIHWIDQYVNETVTVETKSNRRNGNKTTVERPALLTVDPQRFVDTIHELEDIAEELGFSADVNEAAAQEANADYSELGGGDGEFTTASDANLL